MERRRIFGVGAKLLLLLACCSGGTSALYAPPAQPIRVESLQVVANVTLTYAQSEVVSRVRNPHLAPQEYVFSFLLPDAAFVTGFTMVLDNKPYTGFVREKDYAFAFYKSAKSKGLASAYLQAKPRDSKHFTVSVYVPAFATSTFHLNYEELLERKDDLYSYVLNLYPGRSVPDLSVVVYINEGRPIRSLQVPALGSGFGREKLPNPKAPQSTQIYFEEADTEAVVIFRPSLKEQRDLMQDFEKLVSTQGHNSSSGDDVVLKSTEMLGQFMVQYDVDSSGDGDVFVNNGHFIHFLIPKGYKPLNKDVVFVLDMSGSMEGKKIEQLRTSMRSILRELRAGDFFSIVDFADHARTIQQRMPVNPKTIEEAVTTVDALETWGSTNIMAALETALDEIHRPLPSDAEHVDPVKMIIFLTDGRQNVGVTDSKEIIRRVIGHNLQAPNKANIYALAFGEDADKKFLHKLSLSNGGFMAHIYDSSDAAQQLKDFYSSISSPVMQDVVFKYPPDQVEQASMTRHKINLVFQGSQAVAAGKAKMAQISGQVECKRIVDRQALLKYLSEAASRRRRGPTGVVERFGPLERMWAYLNIRQLQDRYIAYGNDTDKEEALDLALKYQFVTPLTALAIVKPDQLSDAITTDSVDGERITGPSQQIQEQATTDVPKGGATPDYVRRLEAKVEQDRQTIAEQAATIQQLRAGAEDLNRKMEDLRRKLNSIMASLPAPNPHRRRRR